MEMTAEQISNTKRQMAIEVMGWEYWFMPGVKKEGYYTKDGEFKYGGDWQPQTNLEQALMVADEICKKNDCHRESHYIHGEYWFRLFSEPHLVGGGHFADTEVEAVYAAICEAIKPEAKS